MKILAAQRLTALKKPKPDQLLENEDKILNSLESLNKWYGDNKDIDLERRLINLDNIFEYKPYSKPVFRAFEMPKELDAEEGKTYMLSTGPRNVQSWTTDADAAKSFIDKQDYKSAQYGVFQLMHNSGAQLCNFEWIDKVVTYIIKATEGSDDLYEMHLDAKALKRYLDQFEAEREVIIKMPHKSEVKLIHKVT